MIKVLVVEDSPAVREFLVHVLGSDPQIRIVGSAANGEEAIEAARRLRPDVITMDIHMPRMNGLEATRRIMETDPRPIVIVSGSHDPREVATTFEAIEAGALAVMHRPEGIGHEDHEQGAHALVRTVKAMAEVRVVRRWARREGEAGRRRVEAPLTAPGIVAIGASTGGPPALHAILAALPADFPAAIVVVQHMAPGFVGGFAQWLSQFCPLPVQLAAHGETVVAGRVYIAPDGFHTAVAESARFVMTRCDGNDGPCPSVSHLFQSVADAFGRDAIAVLLSGMGRDGAQELRELREKGAATFAQDEASSVVHGMPGEAIRLDAAKYVLPPAEIAPVLVALANRKR
ncbi:MAG: chemotaxis-specific protein-glutamate methyltransferase CheB [Burkholderiales bacterium]